MCVYIVSVSPEQIELLWKYFRRLKRRKSVELNAIFRIFPYGNLLNVADNLTDIDFFPGVKMNL